MTLSSLSHSSPVPPIYNPFFLLIWVQFPTMDSNGSSNVKKQDDTDPQDTKNAPKPDTKPIVRTLNRVPRTRIQPSLSSFTPSLNSGFLFFQAHASVSQCLSIPPLSPIIDAYSFVQNACRKQKMRCEGAENPPCRRCRHAGLECLFEKPTREASLTGEAGLECVIRCLFFLIGLLMRVHYI